MTGKLEIKTKIPEVQTKKSFCLDCRPKILKIKETQTKNSEIQTKTAEIQTKNFYSFFVWISGFLFGFPRHP
jgi:hypothetical protein